jgi:hypothetical protein
MYYIYHIPGVKIGCSKSIDRRIKSQGFKNYEILEEHQNKYVASRREIELQKQYGYKVDAIPYYVSLDSMNKALKVTQTHPNTINMDRKLFNVSWKLKKSLLQYDLNGNFIKEWDCGARNMPDEYKNAGGCAKSKKGTLYGYQWRYKTSEDYSKQIGKFQNEMCKKIVQKDLKGNIIKIWDSQQKAADTLGCSIQLISNVCRGIGKTAKGYIWERCV